MTVLASLTFVDNIMIISLSEPNSSKCIHFPKKITWAVVVVELSTAVQFSLASSQFKILNNPEKFLDPQNLKV